MTQNEAAHVLAILKAAYPHSYNGLSKQEAMGTIAVWCIQFADIPVDIVLAALQKAISECKFPPSVADVKNKITEIHFEAYEKISYEVARRALPADVLKQYERIYEVTKPYKVPGMASPSLHQMLENRNMLMLGSGE
jgi:hypothetical protein